MRYLRTVAHLKPEQIVYRLLYEVLGRLPGRPLHVPAEPALRRCVSAVGLEGRAVGPTLADVREGRLSFLNREAEFGPKIDWRAPGLSRLWRYNLHYFDWLGTAAEGDAGFVREVLRDWVAADPAGTPDAWDPFPISLRLVNWIKYFLAAGGAEAEVLRSAYGQTLRLERRLERHILANHLWKNAKALVFAGMFFAGGDADRWLRRGVRLVLAELEEQILPDGAHFERSPMYHSMVFEDCLDLYALCRANPGVCGPEPAARLGAKLPAMAAFLAGMTHPDGRIALFNDAAFGIEAPPAALLRRYERLTGRPAAAPGVKPLGPKALGAKSLGPKAPTAVSFPDAGYYVLSPRPGDRLFVDCGPLGPEYQPGHGHCDLLSFELSLAGRRVVVDAGCSRYEAGAVRDILRGNAGHNTLAVDGLDQSEVWGAHRCGRRARPLSASLRREPDGTLVFEGAHDGYKRLPGRPVHSRRIVWRGRTLEVRDTVSGSGRHAVTSLLHFHPRLAIRLTGRGAEVLDEGRTILKIAAPGYARLELTRGIYCPEFGLELPCPVLRAVAGDVRLPFSGGWRLDGGATNASEV